MHIMDLAIQGVRRFKESRKFPFKPGLNVIFGPTESGKSTLVSCLLDLLYPDRFREEEAPLISWGDPPASRAGLTFASGKDIYRLLKDFKTNRLALTQYNPASQKYEPIGEDPAQIASLLASSFDLPPFDIYYHLFVAAADQMPSSLPLTLAEVKEDKKAETPRPELSAPAPGGMPGMSSAPGFGIPGMMSGPGFAPAPALPGMTPPFGTGPLSPAIMPGPVLPGMPAMPGMTMGPAMPGAVVGPAMPGLVPGAMTGMLGAEDDGMTPEEREQKLIQLRQELKSAQMIEELNYEIDGYQQRIFEIESKKKSATQFDEFLAKAKEQLDQYPIFRRLPEKIDERIDRYKDLETMRGQEVDKIDQQALTLEEELRALRATPPLHQQKLFQAGAGIAVGGVLIFILGGFIPSLSFLRFLLLSAIVGVGLIFYTLWQYFAQTNRKAELEKKVAELDEKKEQVVKRFEVEMAVIEKLMKDSQSDNVEDLKTKLQKYRELDERYKTINEKKKKLMKELNVEAMEREEKELKKKIADLEEELRKHPPISMDPNEMKREIKRLEDLIRQTNPQSPLIEATSSTPTASEGFAVPDLGPAKTAPLQDAGHTRVMSPETTSPAGRRGGTSTQPLYTSSPRLGDSATRMVAKRSLRSRTAPQAFENMLTAAARLFDNERNQVVKHVQQRFNLYVQAFFTKRYTEARIEPDGSIALKQAETGRWVDFEQLTPAARDTGYLALQITLLELAIQKRILPIILDNPLAPLDENATIVTSKALKRLAEKSQVILLSSQRAPIQFADQNLSLA